MVLNNRQWWSITLLFILLKLLIHLPFNSRFGFHADELLYLNMSSDLDWGYKEGPPFTPWTAGLCLNYIGDSVWSVRLIPTIFSTFTLFVTMILVRKFKGNRFALILAGLSLLLSPSFLATGYLLQPSVFEQFFWTVLCLLIVLYLQTSKKIYPILIGLTIGVAMVNKITMLLFAICLLIALLVKREGRPSEKSLIISSAIALVIFSPHLFWQFENNWPVFDHLRELKTSQWVTASRFQLFKELLVAHSFFSLVWIAGIVYLLKNYRSNRAGFFAVAFILMQSLLLASQAKTYYSFGAFPVLFAVGSAYLSRMTVVSSRTKYKIVFAVSAINIVTVPAVVPVLNISNTTRYFSLMKEECDIDLPLRWSDGEFYPISQYYGQMLGWEDLTEKTIEVLEKVPDSLRCRTAVITDNYEQAAAIDFFGGRRVPTPVTIENSYYKKEMSDNALFIIYVSSVNRWKGIDNKNLLAISTSRTPFPLNFERRIYLISTDKGTSVNPSYQYTKQ